MKITGTCKRNCSQSLGLNGLRERQGAEKERQSETETGGEKLTFNFFPPIFPRKTGPQLFYPTPLKNPSLVLSM